MKIFYEKPQKTPKNSWLESRVDKDGNEFWFDWSDWIKATEIDSPKSIKLLPAKIADLIPKWTKDLEIMKNQNNNYSYPIKNVSIRFLYANKFYRLTPDAFSAEYNTRYYFEDAHKIIEKDLQDTGCIYTYYFADLD